MIIYVDIDETICHTINGDYPNSKPIQENIDKINSLYDYSIDLRYSKLLEEEDFWALQCGGLKSPHHFSL